MEIKRAVLTVLAAASLIVAGACKSSSTTTANTMPLQSGETGEITTGSTVTTNTTSPTVTTNTTSYSAPASTTLTTTTTTPQTTTDANGTTTTTMSNGSTVTRSETTTVVYPDGTVKTLTPSESAALGTTTAPNGTQLVNMPAGSAVVTKTVTTITTPPPQNTIVTTTVPVNNQPPMTSSSTTVAYPYPSFSASGRRIPGLDFLVFANRASFSSSNSFPGTLNTGDIRTDIRNQTGYGVGINAWFNRHFSGEITASRIHPQTNFIPANAGVNPITGLRVKMTPITGTLQLHFNPYSTVDAYLGGGAAYVLFKADESSLNTGTSGLTGVNFRDEWGPLVNGGLGFNLSRHFGINLDAKYMWVRARANTTFNTATIGNVGNSERIGVNPFVISAGLRFGF
jgi:outer membrane protein W